MKIENDDDRLILIAAFRYALGRMTYMPSVVAGAIESCWPELTEHDRKLFQNEINEAIEWGHVGMQCDAATWGRILELGGNDDKRPVDLCAEPSAPGRS